MNTTAKLLSLLALTLLLTFCKKDPNIEQAKMDLKNQDFEAALAAAEKAIEMTPETGMGEYYKAVTYQTMAEAESNVGARADIYKKMVENYEAARTKFLALEKAPAELEQIDPTKVNVWATEFNEAVRIAQSDSLKAIDGKLDEAVAHVENTIAIMPDSANNYIVATEVYLMAGQKDKALESLEYMKTNPDIESDASTYLRIALLQRDIASLEESIETLVEGRENFPENINLVQQLAQNYLETGKTDEALATVKELIEIDPNNPQYRLVYGTQLYQSVDVLASDLNVAYDKLFELDQEYKKAARIQNKNERDAATSEIDKQRDVVNAEIAAINAKADDLTAQATAELLKVSELRPNDHDVQYTIAIIYQNKAAALQQQRDNERDNAKAAELDAKAKEELTSALQFYEKAATLIGNDIANSSDDAEKAELMSREKDYWNALFRVYTNLGMNDKAAEAMEKAGL